ncbi:MAG: hypothetical protein RI935_110 [Candidatus Parcubacteria bacterium]|jgi:hypothetical protein
MNGPQFQPQKGESIMVTNETKEVPLSEEKRLRLEAVLQEFLKIRPELKNSTEVKITEKDFNALYRDVIKTNLPGRKRIYLEELRKFVSLKTTPVIAIISKEEKTGVRVENRGQHVKKVSRPPQPRRHNYLITSCGKDLAANQGKDL